MKLLRRVSITLLGFIGFLVLAAAIVLPLLIRRSFPQVTGEIKLPELDAPVEIIRDTFGVPHIYATTTHDLFFAQGYVQAQDRFWQMDFWRHQATGRLSELLGANTLEVDRYLQTLGWERIARREVEALDPDSRLILESFSAGVNAYLQSHAGSEVSLEYAFLGLINRGYEPKPWQPIHSLAWGKAMAWDLRGNMDLEIDRALLMASLTPDQLADLYPRYDFSSFPTIVTDPHLKTGGTSLPSAEVSWVNLREPLKGLKNVNDGLDALSGGGFDGIGSNSWVISGELTDTGMPYLANDPHLAAQIPSIWYEIGLHCVSPGPDCPYQVVGFAFSATPGVVIGHNESIAWGVTNLGPDVMDLYIERVNPQNPDQYEVDGEWVDMELIPVTIQVAGGESEEIIVRNTRHGPILSDVSLLDFADEAGIELPEEYAIALRWTALEPGKIFRAIWSFNRAQNWDEFREAARDFNVPSQNLVYADTAGNIGYINPGWIPVRKPGHDGLLPVPGWNQDYEWQGYIPYEDLPFAFNPPEGYIVTANNAVVGPEYPYSITGLWSTYGYRAQAIVDRLEGLPGKIDQKEIQAIQGDNRDINAEQIIPWIEAPVGNPELIQAYEILKGWNYQAHRDSAPAALYAVFWKNLLAVTFQDDLPEYAWPGGNSRWFEIVAGMLDEPNHPWWDDSSTADIEDRDQIFQRVFKASVAEIQEQLGSDPSEWRWGDLHTLTFRHGVMDSFPLINNLFNEGPFPTSGGSGIINATGWNAASETPYVVGWLPSMRMIVDLSALERSLSVHTTGQSGHAGHTNYIDMADPWRLIEYHPMYWDRGSLNVGENATLTLLP